MRCQNGIAPQPSPQQIGDVPSLGMGEEHPRLPRRALEIPWGLVLLRRLRGLAWRGRDCSSLPSPLLLASFRSLWGRGASSPRRSESRFASPRGTGSRRRWDTFRRAGRGEEAPGRGFCFGFLLSGVRVSSQGGKV